LTGQLIAALGHLDRPRAVHGPGRVLVDLAIAVADGAECISDIAVLLARRRVSQRRGLRKLATGHADGCQAPLTNIRTSARA